MCRYRTTVLTLGLCCSAAALSGICSSSRAGELDRVHLSGALGRYWGIGYSDGYHAHRPNRAEPGHALRGSSAPAYATVQPFGLTGPTTCRECSTSAPQLLMLPNAETLPSSPSVPEASATEAPTPTTEARKSESSALIQQPPRSASSTSERSFFFKRLPSPSVRRDSSMEEAAAPTAPPRKGSVARSSILEPEAR